MLLVLALLFGCASPQRYLHPEIAFEDFLNGVGSFRWMIAKKSADPTICSRNVALLPDRAWVDSWDRRLQWKCAEDGVAYVLDVPGEDGVPGGVGPSADWRLVVDMRAERVTVAIDGVPPRTLSYDDLRRHGAAWDVVVARYREVLARRP